MVLVNRRSPAVGATACVSYKHVLQKSAMQIKLFVCSPARVVAPVLTYDVIDRVAHGRMVHDKYSVYLFGAR